MPRKGYSPEQVLNRLRQVEVAVAGGKSVGQAVREIGVTDHTYFRESALRHQKRVVVLASLEELNIEELFLQLKPVMAGNDVIFKRSVSARMIRVARPLVPTNIRQLIRILL
jgi:hypothetical protein